MYHGAGLGLQLNEEVRQILRDLADVLHVGSQLGSQVGTASGIGRHGSDHARAQREILRLDVHGVLDHLLHRAAELDLGSYLKSADEVERSYAVVTVGHDFPEVGRHVADVERVVYRRQ